MSCDLDLDMTLTLTLSYEIKVRQVVLRNLHDDFKRNHFNFQKLSFDVT